MTAIFPLHYALSEALVAAAAALGISSLIPRNRLGAAGLLPFGLAGLIGAVQIAAGLTGFVATFHQFLSRSGAVFGLICLIDALMPQRDWRYPVAGLLAAGLVAALPVAGMPLFVLLMLGGVTLVYRRAPDGSAVMAAAGFGLLVIAQVVAASLRPAHPDLAWHAFHVLVAAWLLIAAILVPLCRGSTHTGYGRASD